MATPLLQVGADDRVSWVNIAAGSWLGLGLRRIIGHSVNLLAGPEADLAALCARARAKPDGVRAQRVQFGPDQSQARYAHVLASVVDDQVQLELHPIEEFSGPDPALLLPGALAAALKGLAHEVKNPLAGLKGAAQLLRRRVTDPDGERYLEVILAETDRLFGLVQRLLEPAPASPHAPINIHHPVERVRLLAEAEAGWSVRLVRDYDPSLPELSADADRLTQAILNLVRNALQADATEVKLRTRAETNVVIGDVAHRLAIRVEVIDNGHGVPEELAERIFLPLVTGRAEGTGLGLALAQQVAREHGGSLSFRSRRGHTVFTLLLPLSRDSGFGIGDSEGDASA
nr:ATP-binding protein [Pseudomarimonas arenosa]